MKRLLVWYAPTILEKIQVEYMPILSLQERFGLQDIDITTILQSAEQLCNESSIYDKDCASIIKALRNTIITLSDNPAKANTKLAYMRTLKECYEYFIGNEQILIDDKKYIDTYIDGCITDASRKIGLRNLFRYMCSQPKIEIDFLATVFYTLELNFAKETIRSNIPADLRLFNELINLLKPYVLIPELNGTYNACKNLYLVEFTDEHTMVESGREAEIILNQEGVTLFIQAIHRAFKKLDEIRNFAQQHGIKLDRINLALPVSLEEALRKGTQSLWDEKPSCYSINQDNYQKFIFTQFYEFISWSVSLSGQLKNLNNEVINEMAVSFQENAEQYIREAQSLTQQNRMQLAAIPNEEIEQLKIETLPEQNTNLLGMIESLQPRDFQCLTNIFNFKLKETKITLHDVKRMILALGGIIQTFDGSKTRIALPGLHTTRVHVRGGLHVPHLKSDPLEWSHVRLISKTFERAGITKDIILQISDKRSATQSATTIQPATTVPQNTSVKEKNSSHNTRRRKKYCPS